MASLWLKILTALKFRNMVLRARNTTLHVEAVNVADCTEDLKQLQDRWGDILADSKVFAESYGILIFNFSLVQARTNDSAT